ncbi:uncharacterized protein LOC135225741 [Macrobrachium nipponense]|uniref:uncharacterized protein LOC135225741 n=1 Tax=Macrobrachium nipponense TaxID=159736 RepID=UPI0030C829FF
MRCILEMAAEATPQTSSNKASSGTLCWALNCYTYRNRITKEQGITFHKFPGKNKERDRYLTWVRNCRRDKEPNNGSRICSKHFLPKYIFKPAGMQRTHLTEDACPTEFDLPEHLKIFNDPLLQQTEDIAPSHTTKPPGTPVPSTSHENVQSGTPEPSRSWHSTKRGLKRPTASDKRHEVLQEALHQLRNLSQSEEGDNDDQSDFGSVVTSDLLKMNEENKVLAEKLISQVLYIGKLGKLSSLNNYG